MGKVSRFNSRDKERSVTRGIDTEAPGILRKKESKVITRIEAIFRGKGKHTDDLDLKHSNEDKSEGWKSLDFEKLGSTKERIAAIGVNTLKGAKNDSIDSISSKDGTSNRSYEWFGVIT